MNDLARPSARLSARLFARLPALTPTKAPVRMPTLVLALVFALGLAGCAQSGRGALPFEADADWPRAGLLLLGEQHDAPEHQQLSARVVEQLAAQGRLAALAMEMAEAGRSTASLPRDASEAQVREALAWDAAGWPWADYGPIAMAAVRRGVPVVGANLPRASMREAMRDATLDSQIDAPLRRQLQDDVREGHCGLLPDSQLAPMTRVQIARDRSMARTLRSLAAPGRVALLVAGANHVDATRGVPRHLPAEADGPGLRTERTVRTVRLAAGAAPGEQSPGFDETWPTPATPPKDHCAGLSEKLGPAR